MHQVMTKPDDLGPVHSDQMPAPLKRGQSAQVQRDLRSKAALKANMARRKAQVSGKAQGADKAQVQAKETEAANQRSPEDE